MGISRVKSNTTALRSYIDSMVCAIDKAEHGSDCEDRYFIEKLERMAGRLGYVLTKADGKAELMTFKTLYVGITVQRQDVNGDKHHWLMSTNGYEHYTGRDYPTDDQIDSFRDSVMGLK